MGQWTWHIVRFPHFFGASPMSATVQASPVFNRIAEFFGTQDPNAKADSERGPKGTFRNGNRGGPGNPYARRVAKLRQAVMEECGEEDLREITREMINLAKRGDKVAAKLIYQYTLGKPDKQVDPDRVDADELDVLKGVAVPAALLQALLEAVPADAVNRLVQNLWPALVKTLAKDLDAQIVEKQKRNAEMEKEADAWEALPAEEKLRQYRQCGTTPPDDLVEAAEKERVAREAKEQAVPSTNGVSQTSEASPPASNGVNPSTNGILHGGQGTDRQCGQAPSPVSAPEARVADRS
jgi:hypothetical protein